MTLVDTSVWIEHFNIGSRALAALLDSNDVLLHPFIIGELSLGSFSNRSEILRLLGQLPQAVHAGHEEVMHCVQKNQLARSGIGWIDAHLIASALLAGARLLTADKALLKVARRLGIASDRA
jgi:predicted nucleic acid-binding protein